MNAVNLVKARGSLSVEPGLAHWQRPEARGVIKASTLLSGALLNCMVLTGLPNVTHLAPGLVMLEQQR